MSGALPVPAEILGQHIIVLGKTRSGKSSKTRVLVEYLLKTKKRVVILTPKDDWWGLKLGSDGKSEGYPIVAIGGKYEDLPFNPASGAQVAELICSGNRPCLITFARQKPSDRTRFYNDFMAALFKHHQGELHVIIDEIHNWAPKGRVFSPDAGMMIHWTNTLASEGQGQGLILIGASQRPQNVHNDVLSNCETLIACRVIHKAARDADKDWIDGCADPQAGKELLSDLATMERTDAWVWSPEIGFGPQRIKWPMFKTFDSFKPNPASTLAKLKGWADVDLGEVREKLKSVIAEAQANDPKALKAELARLNAELAKMARLKTPAPAPAPKAAPMACPINHEAFGQACFQEGYAQALEAAGTMADKNQEAAARLIGQALEKVHATRPRLLDRPLYTLKDVKVALKAASDALNGSFHAQKTASDARTASDGIALTSMSHPISPGPMARSTLKRDSLETIEISLKATGLTRALLEALVWFADIAGMASPTRAQLGAFAGKKSRGGYFDNTVSSMKTSGLVEIPVPGTLRITDAGRAAVADYEPNSEQRTVSDMWVSLAGEGLGREIMLALIHAHPSPLSRTDLGDFIGKAPRGGYFDNTVSRLKTLGALTYPSSGYLALTPQVMP
jgi:hypothetical protein